MKIGGLGVLELLIIIVPIAIIVALVVFIVIRISNSSSDKSQAPAKCDPETSSMDELIEYKKLYDSGVISQQDFEKKKQELLGN